MGRKRTTSGNTHLPPGVEPPPDENVKLPSQVRHAAAVADAKATGQPVPPQPKPQQAGFPHNDAEIDAALQLLRVGKLQLSSPEFKVISDLAEAGGQHIKSRRLGAQRPRENSDLVTRRMEHELQAYRELAAKRPHHRPTVKDISRHLQKRGVHVSEATITKDLRELAPLMRLVQEGKIPPPGFKPISK